MKLLLCLLLVALRVQAAFVQAPAGVDTGSGQSSVSISFSSTPAVGSIIVVFLSSYNGLGFTVDDNQGNTYAGKIEDSQGNTTNGYFCASAATASGTFTVTGHASTSGYLTILVAEYAGLTCTTDGTSAGVNTGDTCPGITTSGTSATVFCGSGGGIGGVCVAGGSATMRATDTTVVNQPACLEAQVVSAGSYTLTMTTGGGGNQGSLVMALAASASSGAPRRRVSQ